MISIHRLILLGILFCNSTLLAFQFHHPARGAADLALGGSLVAVGGGAACLFDNPAALALCREAQAKASVSYTDRDGACRVAPENIGVALPLMIGERRFVFGLAGTKLWDLDGTRRLSGARVTAEGYVYGAAIGAAHRVRRWMLLGMSLGMAQGEGAELREAVSGDWTRYQLNPAYLINLGVLFSPYEVVRVGVGYARRYQMNYQEDITSPFSYGMPSVMHLPAEFRLGIFAAPGNRLRLMVAIEVIGWRRFMLSHSETSEVFYPVYAGNATVPITSPQSVELSCGLEYLLGLVPPRLVLRVGLHSAGQGVPETLINYDAGVKLGELAYNSGIAGSAGLGVIYGNWNLDLAGEYERTRLKEYTQTDTLRGMVSLGWTARP